MPEIPLFQGGETTKTRGAPAMPLDTVQRPRMDFSGVIGALAREGQQVEELGRAKRQPLKDPNMYAGENRGLAILGQGIGQVGEMFGKLAEARADAKNYADTADAEAVMQQAVIDHEKERDPTNPDSWGDDLRKRLDAAHNQINQAGYAPVVNDHLKAAFGRFAQQHIGRVEIDATKATFARAKDAGMAQYYEAMNAGDREGMTRPLAELSARGLITQTEAVTHRIQGESHLNARENAELENQKTLAKQNGDFETPVKITNDQEKRGLILPQHAALERNSIDREAVASKYSNLMATEPQTVINFASMPRDKRPEDFRKLNDAQTQQVLEQATGALFKQQNDSAKLAVHFLESGGIKSPEDVDTFRDQFDPHRQLYPQQVDALKLKLMPQADVVLSREAIQRMYAEADEAISRIDPVKDKAGNDAQSNAIETSIRLSPIPNFMQERLFKNLNEHLSEADNVTREAISDVKSLKSQALKDGIFSDKKIAATDDNGNPIFKTQTQVAIPETVREGWFPWISIPWINKERPGTIDDAPKDAKGKYLTKQVPVPIMVPDPSGQYQAVQKAQAIEDHVIKQIREKKLTPAQARDLWNSETMALRASADAIPGADGMSSELLPTGSVNDAMAAYRAAQKILKK